MSVPEARLERQFWLSRGMARASGVDLAGALRRGRLDRQDYRAALALCCACTARGACLDWLSDPRNGGAGPPEFCAIRPILRRLRLH